MRLTFLKGKEPLDGFLGALKEPATFLVAHCCRFGGVPVLGLIVEGRIGAEPLARSARCGRGSSARARDGRSATRGSVEVAHDSEQQVRDARVVWRRWPAHAAFRRCHFAPLFFSPRGSFFNKRLFHRIGV